MSPLLPALLDTPDDAQFRLTVLVLAAFSACWIAAVGGSIGSFLNVVVYRLPRGMSLSRPKSHCPKCGTAIRRGDNLPVLGWLRLRGRCRTCGLPISARYPLVEAATATLFLALAHAELFTAGANLPNRLASVNYGPLYVIWETRWDLVALTIYHISLLCLLLAIGLTVWDGFAPPRTLRNAALVLGLLPPVVLPFLHPVPAFSINIVPGHWPVWTTSLPGGGQFGFTPAALVTGLTGLLAGLALAQVLVRAASTPADRGGVRAALAAVGMFLGPQAAVSAALLAAVLAVVVAVASQLLRRPLPSTIAATTAGAVQLFAWSFLNRAVWWPAAGGFPWLRKAGWSELHSDLLKLLLAVAVILLCTGLAWLIRRTPSQPVPSEIA